MYKSLGINDIKNSRKKIQSVLLKANSFPNIDSFDNISQHIIIDALVYLYYKLGDEFVLNSLNFNSFVDKFLSNIKKDNVINFQSVINSYLENASCKHTFNIEEILKTSNICDYPDANLATQIFLLRGNFNWDLFPMTSFSTLLQKNLSDVPSDATLNCWEACLLALYRANLVSIDTLHKLYLDNNLKPLQPNIIYDNIVDFFKTDNILTKDNVNTLNKKSFVINFFNSRHVMLSVPFSQKQILKMLITQDFSEVPSHFKLYSLWDEWTFKKLGTVKKSEFYDTLEFTQKTKPINLHNIEF